MIKSKTFLTFRLNSITNISSKRMSASYYSKQAVELDNEGNYEKAIKFYAKACQYLNDLGRNDNFQKKIYFQKEKEYKERMKSICNFTILKSEAVEYAKKGIENDKKGTEREAINYFKQAAEKLDILYKTDDNQKNKEKYLKHANSYLERAKNLEKTFDSNFNDVEFKLNSLSIDTPKGSNLLNTDSFSFSSTKYSLESKASRGESKFLLNNFQDSNYPTQYELFNCQNFNLNISNDDRLDLRNYHSLNSNDFSLLTDEGFKNFDKSFSLSENMNVSRDSPNPFNSNLR